MSNQIILGIDLGTTYSCVAYVDEFGKAVTLKNADGDLTTPSVVHFTDEQNQDVGAEAKNYEVMDPEHTVSCIKRQMGTDFRRNIYGTAYSPQEISSKILRKLVNDANDALREQSVLKEGDVNKVVITCPAYFGVAEKQATKDAGELIGLEVIDIINEPTAAAINYGMLNSEDNGKRVMVYDLGGGTFDVTVIEIEDNKINVVCTGGDPQLGGKDWDTALVEYFVKCWQEEKDTSEDITDNLETLCSFLEAAEKAKKSLTSKQKANVILNHDGERMRLELTRENFDQITKELLDKTIDYTNSCIQAAAAKGCPLEKIDEILLVGGSSRMPQVKQRLDETYKIKTSLFDPDEAVAKGAALYAQIRTNIECGLAGGSGFASPVSPIVINNVSSRTYGVDVIDRFTKKPYISNFIFQNDTLPKTDTQTFCTLENNQTGVKFDVYESLGSDARIDNFDNATKITTIYMKFEKPVPVDTEIITTMRLENSGLLYVEAEEQLYHSKLKTSFEIANTLSESEKMQAKERAKNSTVE